MQVKRQNLAYPFYIYLLFFILGGGEQVQAICSHGYTIIAKHIDKFFIFIFWIGEHIDDLPYTISLKTAVILPQCLKGWTDGVKSEKNNKNTNPWRQADKTNIIFINLMVTTSTNELRKLIDHDNL